MCLKLPCQNLHWWCRQHQGPPLTPGTGQSLTPYTPCCCSPGCCELPGLCGCSPGQTGRSFQLQCHAATLRAGWWWTGHRVSTLEKEGRTEGEIWKEKNCWKIYKKGRWSDSTWHESRLYSKMFYQSVLYRKNTNKIPLVSDQRYLVCVNFNINHKRYCLCPQYSRLSRRVRVDFRWV